MKTTILIDVNSLAIKDVHFTTQKAWDGHIGMQIFRRNAEDLRVLSADANYSWSDLRKECRSNSTRPLGKHREQTPLQKTHNARMNEDYNQRWMSETGFSQLKEDNGEKLRSRNWHGQFRELTRKCIVHNLTQAASPNSLPAPPSPDVSGRGIAVVTGTTKQDTIVLTLR
jgi:IS5 family transposase